MSRATDLLAEYRTRRDFSRTAEPAGEPGQGSGGNVFVVQKHDATRLHFDFRLELDGVLKSWAVTRGPSLDPADKRLAVRTEDHPLDYATFEGTIPKDQYGGGTVMLWDFGTWTPVGDPLKGIKDGKLKFELAGERMKGGWTLVRMKPKKGEKRENWLLIKERDDKARDGASEPRGQTSISTGRTMAAIARGAPAKKEAPAKTAKSPAKPRTARMPDWREPQLATLVDTVPTGADWLFEMKYDGYRCLAALDGDTVRLYTRNGHDWTDKFGHLVAPLQQLGASGTLIDGEICAFDEDGKTSFSALKTALSDGGPLVFFAFDLLEHEGKALASQTQRERKQRLETLIGRRARHDALQYSPDIEGRGEEVFEAICKAGHEGVIAKRADARYRSGRSKSWLKIKCTLRQEFIIVGFSPSEKRRNAFASLLLATEEEGRLVYRGRVGTGFSDDTRELMQSRLDGLARKTPPLEGVPRTIAREAHWVTPELVAEIAYAERTPDGHLRHPSFLGMREDKPASGIGLEEPAAANRKNAKKPPPDAATAEADLSDEAGIAVAERLKLRLTNPGRVLFPSQGITKARLVAYYDAVAEAMLPHLADRPLSLVRCPAGRARQCFFQKHDAGGFGGGIKSLPIEEKSGKTGDYLYLTGIEGIVAAVQMGVLEFHIWGARRDLVEKPDRIVFDIDPDEGLGFADVRSAALDFRSALSEMGLETFPMVTGGKGIHVVAPLNPRRADWGAVKTFAADFAKDMATAEPDRFTATMSKARRKGRMFIDYLRNERGSTAISPFSTRAREGAPVAVPVTWDEVETLKSANGFNLEAAVARAREPEVWKGYFDLRQPLPRRS
ncbi:DNA ligase D [Pelagibacterium montanilacus]|uniref:DNA ligase D n=1 Tax=Pelagibacterium montanilacus TaxID=2185280 RepID=UPI000F8EB5F2|nr:DNA ligase D [Pelagibacterium montanilacus]